MRYQIFRTVIALMLILFLGMGAIYGESVGKHGLDTAEVDLRDYRYIEKMPISHQLYLIEKAKESSFSPEFLFAVIKLESEFNPNNVGYNKDKYGNVLSIDRGYFQMNSRYDHWYAKLAGLKEYNVFNPYNSIDMGIAGLEYWRSQAIKAGYTNEYDILRYTLNSYNMGEGGFRKYMRRTGTMDRAYSRIILNTTKEYMIERLNRRTYDASIFL